jgi:hypothetical protein
MPPKNPRVVGYEPEEVIGRRLSIDVPGGNDTLETAFLDILAINGLLKG